MCRVLALVLAALLGADAVRMTTRKDTAGVWDEGVDPEAYYEDEDFFAPKVPSRVPVRPAAPPASKTFFLEKNVQVLHPSTATDGWMEPRFVDKSVVQKLAAQGPKAKEHRQRQQRRLREEKHNLIPTDFRFKSLHQNSKGTPFAPQVMPSIGGIGYTQPGGPCRQGISNVYFGDTAGGPGLYPGGPCNQWDFTPYYQRPVRPLLPETEVGIQSPPVNFYSDGGRYPQNMERYDHYAAQGMDTGMSPNSQLTSATMGGVTGGVNAGATTGANKGATGR